MKFILGALAGLFVICCGLFAANEAGVIPQYTAQVIAQDAMSEAGNNDAVDGPVIEIETSIESDDQNANEQIELDDSSSDVLIRQGTDMVVENTVADQGHFISTITGEVVTGADVTAHILPENINLFIAETSQFRLNAIDIDGLPRAIKLVIWPNNELIDSGRPYYLLTPPLNALDRYALDDIVNDQSGHYEGAFPSSKGIFVRDLAILSETSNFTKAVYSQMAQSNKSLIVFSGFVDPNLNKVIDETQVDFQRIDFVIDQDHERVSVKAQWDAIVEKARHGEELNILFEANEKGLSELKSSIGG